MVEWETMLSGAFSSLSAATWNARVALVDDQYLSKKKMFFSAQQMGIHTFWCRNLGAQF